MHYKRSNTKPMNRKFALLLSTSEYQDSRLSRLVAPPTDAAALAEVLRDPAIGNFEEVSVLTNENSYNSRCAISEFFANKRPQDLLLLYFSGHGILDMYRHLYLATTDTVSRRPRARSIEASFIKAEMDESSAKSQVVILDCCHSGAFSRGIKGSVGEPVDTGTRFEGDGRIVLAASDAMQYAYEGDILVGTGTRSLFTHYLVEGLKTGMADLDRDGEITIDELYTYAYDCVVKQNHEQTPVKSNYKQRGKFIIARSTCKPTAGRQQAQATSAPPPKRFRTLIVDPMYRGDYPTVAEAITAAAPGDKIVVRRGIYDESLTLDKPLEIVGDGKLGDVVIQSTERNTLLFKADIGYVRNLVLRQNSSENWYCVNISQGRLTLENCDICSQSLAGVAIHNGADPILRGNQIHDSKQNGVYVYEQGQGLLEGNDIFANALAGVAIYNGADPILRNNQIHDGKASGVYVYEQGQGLLEDNDIFANALAGVAIHNGADPILRNNQIHE